MVIKEAPCLDATGSSHVSAIDFVLLARAAREQYLGRRNHRPTAIGRRWARRRRRRCRSPPDALKIAGDPGVGGPLPPLNYIDARF